MASTSRTTLSRYFPNFARRNVLSSANPLERNQHGTNVSISASSSADSVVYVSDGPAYLRAITFVPDTAVSSSGSNYWTLTFNKNDSAGSQTSLGTFTTNGSALTQYAKTTLLTPSANTVIEDGQNVSIAFVKTSSPANFSGRVVLSFIAIEV